jgi:hypothetical protein
MTNNFLNLDDDKTEFIMVFDAFSVGNNVIAPSPKAYTNRSVLFVAIEALAQTSPPNAAHESANHLFSVLT